MSAHVKKLPIGIERFREFKTDDFYYVDKTGFISELLRTRGSVNLFTRPRRFGKSLNMDMLKSFFEMGADPALFEGLEISRNSELCKQYMGKYPVVSISLKDVDGEDFQTAYDSLAMVISAEATRYDSLLQSNTLTEYDKAKLIGLIEGRLERPAYLHNSLKLLTDLLYRHFGIPVIILIDEYDVPLDKAYQEGYYPQMVKLIRAVFSQALKTNASMYFAVVTGCLRIARESIFTGLNNFKVRTISDVDCAEYFGFTDHEVEDMLKYYGAEERFQDVKEWYDGYHFGNVDVYCPWDVINQCDKFRVNKNAQMESHWANSSGNEIIRKIIEEASENTKAEIESLISGEYIEKKLIPELTYTDFDSEDLNTRQTYLWSVLFATGYLTDACEPQNGYHKLIIPNREILGLYETKISTWFQKKITGNSEKWKNFCAAFKNGDASGIQNLFNDFMGSAISIRDTYVKKEMKENFYHGMLVGLLEANGNWVVKSNTESGSGYSDILLMLPNEKTGCVIEVKYAEKGTFEKACELAMKQIRENNYTEVLEKEGMERIYCFGIACYRKTCMVKGYEVNLEK